MELWRIALMPGSGHARARPRWLCSDGRFSLAEERAWGVAEPATAARRLQQWLQLHGRDPALLHRLRLIPRSRVPASAVVMHVQSSEENRAEELRALGWSAEDVRRYEDLWEYRQRWGAINLEREDRVFLRKAEAALPRRVSGKGSEKKQTRDKSHYRWLAFYRQAMQDSAAAIGVGAEQIAAWPLLLEEELRVLDYYEPVLGLPDTLKARELVAFREQWIAQAAQRGQVLSFDFIEPLEALKRQESCSWKPLRGDGNTDSSYPVLNAEEAQAFRAELRPAIAAEIRRLFPSLQDSDKPAPDDDWQPQGTTRPAVG